MPYIEGGSEKLDAVVAAAAGRHHVALLCFEDPLINVEAANKEDSGVCLCCIPLNAGNFASARARARARSRACPCPQGSARLSALPQSARSTALRVPHAELPRMCACVVCARTHEDADKHDKVAVQVRVLDALEKEVQAFKDEDEDEANSVGDEDEDTNPFDFDR